jgi:hypothetical protein
MKWSPGAIARINITLSISKELQSAFEEEHPVIDRVCILLTAERDFDPQGLQRTPWNENASTLLTPGGLPIEGGGSSAVSRFTGYSFRTPLDVMIEAPISSFQEENKSSDWIKGIISAAIELPKDLPPGIYRLRLDFGFKSGSGWYSFNGDQIGSRPEDPKDISCLYSPPIASSGKDATGKMIDRSDIRRRCYWVLLWNYSSNGYRGVVAAEDKERVAISPRHIIHDEAVLPRFDSNGDVMAYNLEPAFLLDSINPQRSIPWRYNQSEYSVKVTLPNGS